ncbi:hypothetical protein THRCLA_20412 [Thraustotheca clavata]|uniref:FYVE-type domain-containing protein n=1 Tax=Thraustotheca clavata TaxID=74557 RepID=A0A1W0A7H6_9STRA|nr:hypothetical protein THRCLA_20412 [Thraustotheca clavata]
MPILDDTALISLQKQLDQSLQKMLKPSSGLSRDHEALRDGYKLVKVKQGQHLYTRTRANSPFLEVLSIGHSLQSLDDVLDLCYTPTSEELRMVEGLVHGEKYLDAAVLETTFTATLDDPFRWFGIKFKQHFMIGGFEKRQTTYAEYSGTTIDELGQRVLFVVRESLDQQPPASTPDVVCYKLRSVTLFTECQNGNIQDIHYSYTDPSGKFPAWLFNQQLVIAMPITHRMTLLAQKKRLLLMAKHKPLDYEERPTRSCSSCADKLGVFRHKRFCLACNHVMCRRCTVKVPQALPMGSVAHVEFCKRCFLSAKDPNVPSQHLAWMDEDAIQFSVIARRRFYSSQPSAPPSMTPTSVPDEIKYRRSSVGYRNSSITTTASIADLNHIEEQSPIFAQMDESIKTQRDLVEKIRSEFNRRN